MNSVPEIRREKVLIPPEMTSKEIREKYNLPIERAQAARRKGFFVKNYSQKRVIVDPENFDPSISYSTAKRVFWKNFAWNTVAVSIKEDLIQEAVTRMYELSGKVKKRSNEKYGIGYGYLQVAHNAMISYLKTWRKGQRWKGFKEVQELREASEEESVQESYRLMRTSQERKFDTDPGIIQRLQRMEPEQFLHKKRGRSRGLSHTSF